MLLELFLYHPNLFGKRHEGESPSGAEYNFAWGYGWQKRLNTTESNDLEAIILPRDDLMEEWDPERFTSLLPSSNSISESNYLPSDATLSDDAHSQSNWLHHYHALLWTILLLPVPLSRIHLHDHSRMQILVGSLVGIILGTIWYFCIIRGRIFWSGALNSKEFMECLVNSRFGKYIGLNLGVGGKKSKFIEIE